MSHYCSNQSCRRRWLNFRARKGEKVVKCHACRQPATKLKRVSSGVASVYVLPDFPEHFNISMGCVVKNRAHHRQIQREKGLQDWEPTGNSPGSQLVADLLRRGH